MGVIGKTILMLPNKFIANIANIKTNNKSNPPTLSKAGNVVINVCTIIDKLSDLRAS